VRGGNKKPGSVFPKPGFSPIKHKTSEPGEGADWGKGQLEPGGPAQERCPQVLKTGRQAPGFFKYAVIRRKSIDLQRIAGRSGQRSKDFRRGAAIGPFNRYRHYPAKNDPQKKERKGSAKLRARLIHGMKRGKA
jgi:hypothetical protein